MAFVEVSAWRSQAWQLSSQSSSDWGLLRPFYKTEEWNQALLQRIRVPLGIDVFWTPLASDWPEFDKRFAADIATLMRASYDLVVVDLGAAVAPGWRQFWFDQSVQTNVIITPDPTGVKSLEYFVSQSSQSHSIQWAFNQVSKTEYKRLKQKFASTNSRFIGCLRRDDRRFWQQSYKQQPVVMQRGRTFRKDLLSLLLHFFPQDERQAII